MSEPKQPPSSMVLPLPMLVVSVLAMIGAITLAMMLIPQLSRQAAIRGGLFVILSFLFTQLALRVIHARRRRGQL